MPATSATPRLDRDDLEALYARLEEPLFNVVYRWLWDREESRDVVQEAFVRLWSMRARVRMATVEPLVYRIAVNLAARRRRAVRRWGWLPFTASREPSTAVTPAHRLLDGERDRQLRAAVEALPDKLRAVVLLCEFSELSYAQVAEALQIPTGTVGSRRNLALQRLRSALGDPPEEES